MVGTLLAQAPKSFAMLREFLSFTGEPLKGKVCDFDVIDAVDLIDAVSNHISFWLWVLA